MNEARRLVHDLNNILAAASGYADMLAEDLGPDSPHRAQAEKLLQAQTSAAAIVARLLDVLKP